MIDTLVILGAGGHAKVCYEIAVEMGKWSNYIILDDDVENDFFEVKGKLSEFINYPNADFFVAIGSNEVRKTLVKKIEDEGYKLVTLIHPSAIISTTAQIGEGTVVMPGVIVNANTIVGQGCILNTSCSIDHDNIIWDFVHISPGSPLAGTVEVGENTHIGIGSTVINDIQIEKNIIIGAGSTIVEHIAEEGIYFGTPAKKWGK